MTEERGRDDNNTTLMTTRKFNIYTYTYSHPWSVLKRARCWGSNPYFDLKTELSPCTPSGY